MANPFLFANFINTTLAAPVTTGATTISVSSVTGMPTISGSDVYALVLTDAATNSVHEVVYVTSASGTNLTVIRAQEGTAALAWSAGDYVSLDLTAGQQAAMVQGFQSLAAEGSASFSSTTTLTTANFGQTCLFTGTAAATLTLPLSDLASPYESKIVFRNIGTANVTIAVQGGNTLDTSNAMLAPGQAAAFIADGSTIWRALWNDAAASVGVSIGDYKFTSVPLGSAPSGWLFAAGQAVSRTTYSAYFALVGTTYGSGDGSTTFNVPDGRGRFLLALDNMGGTAAGRVTSAGSGIDGTTLGANGGNQYQQQHNHAVSDPGHVHPFSSRTQLTTGQGDANFEGGSNWGYGYTTANTSSATTGISTATAGLGGSQNMPPAITCNVLIYVGV